MGHQSLQDISFRTQLLAINALFDMARVGLTVGERADRLMPTPVSALVDIGGLCERLNADPTSVGVEELDDAHAALLYHSLFS